MTAAPTYNRQYNFTNYQTLNPATPLPGLQVDIELSSVKVTLDALNANLNLIQRSDGQLANASVGPQQLQPGLLTGISPPTQWSGASVSYQVGQTVFYGFLFYVCNMANVSSNANPPSTFTAWTLLADFSGITIPAGSITSAAFAPGAVNSAALGANLALPGSPSATDNSTAIATTAFVQTALGSVISGSKNRIMNGNMVIDQRNGGGVGTSVGYTIDRWKYQSTQSGKAAWQQLNANGPLGFPFLFNIFTSTPYVMASTDNSNLGQTIEANDCSDLQWGTSIASNVTLFFFVNCAFSGTYGGAIQNSGATRSYPFSFSVVANTWTPVSVTIPGDQAGTWLTSGTGAGIVLKFSLGAGSTFLGTGNTWQNGNFTAPTGAGTQIIGAAGNSFSLTAVSLQAGGNVIGEFRPVAVETALCQRYFETQGQDIISVNATSGSGYRKYTSFHALKRVSPTVTFSAITALDFPTSSPSINSPDKNGIRWGAVANATGSGAFLAATWAADADF